MAEDKKKRNARQYEWIKEKNDRINFVMPKGMKEKINLAAYKTGKSSSEWIREAINEKLEREKE